MRSITVLLALIGLNLVSLTTSRRLDLSSNWRLLNANRSLSIANVTIPTSVTTVLNREKIIDDPLYRYNDEKYRWIVYENDWVFQTSFLLQSDDLNSPISLVFNSIDTIASVFVNDKNVLNASNQFVEYEVTLLNRVLVSGVNKLEVRFESPVLAAKALADKYPYRVPPECVPREQHGECHANFLRKQQCSFAWDWGPAFVPIGINGPVYLRIIDSFDFDFWASVYPRPTVPQKLTDWEIEVDIRLNQTFKFGESAVLTARIDELNFVYTVSNLTLDQNNVFKLKFSLNGAYKIALWWPNGYGAQQLYELKLAIEQPGSGSVNKTKRIGFRSVQLIQDPVDSHPEHGLTFYFKINNVPVFLKGSNWIPADPFNERISSDKLNWLLKSTQLANMNVLRVWGGGNYESDEFYDLADQLGIMIWQDFMFACATYPTDEAFLNNVISEVTYQVNRLKHHPSIIIWAGNNENELAVSTGWWGPDVYGLYGNDYRTLYVKTIMSIVKRFDSGDLSRPYLSSSPTNGQETIKENWLAADPSNQLYGDVHYYNYGVNWWIPDTFLMPRMMSEFGLQSMPSFSTLADAYLFPDDADFLHGNLSDHRQHHGGGNIEILNEIQLNMRLPDITDQVQNLKAIIYLSQINQAMGLRTGIELLRRWKNKLDNDTGKGYSMGTMYWQLNDVWQAPTWSSIEYHIDGGKWKLAHYFVKQSFRAFIISPAHNDTHIILHGVSDINADVDVSYTVNVYSFDSLTTKYTYTNQSSLGPLGSQPLLILDGEQVYKQTGCQINAAESCILTVEWRLNDQPSGEDNFLLFNNQISEVTNLANATVTIVSVVKVKDQTFAIDLETDAVALFVRLDLETTSIRGRFSDNGFHMTTAKRQVLYVADSADVTVDDLKKYLSVQTLANLY